MKLLMVGLLSALLMGLVSTSIYLGVRVDRLSDRFHRHVEQLASGQAAENRAAGLESKARGKEFAEDRFAREIFARRIADFDEQRFIARQRVEAALAEYEFANDDSADDSASQAR